MPELVEPTVRLRQSFVEAVLIEANGGRLIDTGQGKLRYWVPTSA